MNGKANKEFLTNKELPFTVAMVVLDIVAPILLMLGITMTNSANVSLLNNFEIVATSIIALVIFKEIISKKLWFAMCVMCFMSRHNTFLNNTSNKRLRAICFAEKQGPSFLKDLENGAIFLNIIF